MTQLSDAQDHVLRIYDQLTDIVGMFAEVVQRQKLTDQVLLQVKLVRTKICVVMLSLLTAHVVVDCDSF